MPIGKKVLKLRAQAKKFSFKYDTVSTPVEAKGRYYPADDIVFKKGPTPVRNAPKIRSTITPGTVCILLAGRFQGKRVVVLKALDSGLLLVTGPYSLNGVPLRRVSQRYVIATKTKIPLTGVDVSSINDGFFAREKVAVKEGEEALFDTTEQQPVTAPHRKAAQTKVDEALLVHIKKVSMLESYLKIPFTLTNADKPHLMKF